MKKRTVLFLLILCVITACFSGCGMTKQTLLIDGEEITVDTLLEIDGNKISLFEYRYYFANDKTSFDSGISNYWEMNPEAFDVLKAYTLNDIKYAYAMRKLADGLGIKLGISGKLDVNDAISATKSEYSTNELYKAYLESVYLDEALFKKITENTAIATLIYEHYFGENGVSVKSDIEIYDYIRENYYRYKMIYIKLDYDGTQTNKNLADNIAERLRNGESFDDLMSKYSRDVSSQKYSNGYYVKSKSDSKTTAAIAALDENQCSSEYIETEDGYYFFKRLSMNNLDLKNDMSTFRSVVEGGFIDEKVNEIADKMEVKIVSDYYDKITFDSLLHE